MCTQSTCFTFLLCVRMYAVTLTVCFSRWVKWTAVCYIESGWFLRNNGQRQTFLAFVGIEAFTNVLRSIQLLLVFGFFYFSRHDNDEIYFSACFFRFFSIFFFHFHFIYPLCVSRSMFLQEHYGAFKSDWRVILEGCISRKPTSVQLVHSFDH